RTENPNVRRLAAGARQALSRFETGEVATLLSEADGTISGVVLDPSGRPVPGVVVTAVPETRPFDLVANWRAARKTPHVDRDLGVVAQEAIHNELWRRMVRRSARTDPNGRYEITGLMDAGHNLTAYHERFDVKPLTQQRGRIQPDATVDFTANSVLETKVEVRLPDGTLADHASLQWEGPHGRGGDSWLKEPGTVRLPIGRCKIKATTTVPEPMESKEVEREIAPDRSGDKLVLTLEGRKVLTARLVLPEGFALPRTVEYRMRKVDNGDIEPEALLKDQSQRHARSPSPGRAYWYDLEPGRYLVAAFLNKRRLLAHAIAEVGDGPAEVELPVTEPDAGSYVKVKLIGPDGGPVPGQVSFRIITETKGRKSTKTADALPQGDVWLVYLDGIAKQDGTARQATMRVGTRDYGGAVEEFTLRGGGTITFRFDKAARLNLKLERFNGSGVEGSLFVALRGKLGADAWRIVSPDGSCNLSGVQPGPYDLMLYVRKNNRHYPIYRRNLRLNAGEDELSLAVPSLHTLNVRWRGKGRPRSAILRCKDQSVGDMRRDARLRGNVASFDQLAPGTYEVEIARKRVSVRVPGPPELVIQ
ncbi:MAG: carboxypeptidase-like regulatory domain-containing protein, partial [Planctomycetota bacterium]